MSKGIYKAKSELQRYENELKDAEEQKMHIMEIIDHYEPRTKSSKLKGVVVNSSLNTKANKLLDYVAVKEQFTEELAILDIAIKFYKKEIKRLKKFITKEESRLTKYNEWEQKIIYMREAKCTWLQIACSVPYSEIQCKRIYYKYKDDTK